MPNASRRSNNRGKYSGSGKKGRRRVSRRRSRAPFFLAVAGILLIGAVAAVWKYNPGNIVDQASRLLNEEDAKSAVKVVHKKRVVLDVPLINQMDDPKLYNGCEVTSLAMVLNYNGIDVTTESTATPMTGSSAPFPEARPRALAFITGPFTSLQDNMPQTSMT